MWIIWVCKSVNVFGQGKFDKSLGVTCEKRLKCAKIKKCD